MVGLGIAALMVYGGIRINAKINKDRGLRSNIRRSMNRSRWERRTVRRLENLWVSACRNAGKPGNKKGGS